MLSNYAENIRSCSPHTSTVFIHLQNYEILEMSQKLQNKIKVTQIMCFIDSTVQKLAVYPVFWSNKLVPSSVSKLLGSGYRIYPPSPMTLSDHPSITLCIKAQKNPEDRRNMFQSWQFNPCALLGFWSSVDKVSILQLPSRVTRYWFLMFRGDLAFVFNS
jgi:hypothetical protein